MAEIKSDLKRPSSWPRKLMWFGIGFLILLLVLYFVATSAAFLKSVILPRVGKSMNSTITVGDASIKPFSGVVIKDLKLTPNGADTLLTAQEVRTRYSLFKIIGGTIKVDEVALISPVVQLVENADGSKNIDPILKALEKEEKKKEPEKKAEEPTQIDLKRFNLSNATVRSIKHHKGGTRDIAEISNLNITLDDLKNGATAKLALGADIKVENNPPAPGTNGALQAKLNGNFTAAFSADLKPNAIQGSSQLNVERTSGNLADLSGLAATVSTDVTPTEIKQVALQFKKGAANLGEIRASGPLDLNKMEGQVNVLVLSIDKQVLNLAGAASGVDFGSTVINSTNQIQLASGGNMITALGQLGVSQLSIKRDGQTTPALDLQLNYHTAVNNAEKAADVRAFSLTGVQQQRAVLKGELTSPMRISWGNAATQTGDSTFRLVVDSLNLADWKALAGDIAGKVNMVLNIQSQQSGKQLALDLTSQIDGLAMTMGSNTLQNLAVTLRTRGQAVDLNRISVPEYRVEASHSGQPMLAVSGNAQMDRAAQTTDAQLAVEGQLPALLKALGRPDANASSGTLKLDAKVAQKGEAQNVTGKLTVASFTGRYGEQRFKDFGVAADLDAAVNGPDIQLRKAEGQLTGGGKPGGTFDVTGRFNSEKQAGEFALKLVNINENAVRPFIEPMFTGKQLVSIAVNGSANARYEARNESSVKADFKVANLALRDPTKPNPQTPLEAGLKLDTSLKDQVVDVKQCELALTPTQKAKNTVAVTGRLDMSQTNAMQGNLKIASDSLDLTPYYDLVAGDKQPEKPGPAAPGQPQPSPADANKEPEPTKLPLRNSTVDIQIGRLVLREVDIANFKSIAKVDGPNLLLKPCEMTLNGAPVSAAVDLDLGVPGYKYAIAFNATKVPLEPLANSFSPEYKGQAKGELLANVAIKGAGTTGVNLKKTLTGQTSFTVTNANIQLSTKWKKVIDVIAVVLRVGELTKSPINWLALDATMGGGNIKLERLNVVSDAFIAESQGVIPIADILTNSPLNRIPIELSLKRSIAQNAHLIPANTPPDTPYVKLPTFARVTGTLGAPKADTDEKVILGLLAKSASGIPGVVGGDAGKILQGVGGFLSGDRGTNRPAATNQPQSATNKAPSLFDLIPRKKK
ncbi:MAG: hypothetical protein L0Y58_18955 [Verrucomicrobia subdivision 3 bacterium]|nr:hypothetical protein [Limisphaerales bacterium]